MTAAATPSSLPAVPRPEVTPAAEWVFPTPQRLTLPNGMAALVYDVPGQYVVSVRLTVPLPLRAEPREREGVAWVMARLLDEGTTAHDQRELSELLERKGIGIGAGMSESALGMDMDVAQRHLADGLALLTECVATPAFDEQEVRRCVKTRLAEFEQERASAPHRAIREFAATYFDPSSRASRPSAGAPETVSQITRDDVGAFHAAQVRPDAATVVVAGDLTGVDVEGLLAGSLGAWQVPGEGIVRERVEAPRASGSARIVLVDRPGSVQSEIIIGAHGPDRRVEPSWAPFPVLAWVVGGAPNARIDAVLREEKGYTYGIRSGFRPRQVGGAFVVSGSVRADATAESVELLLGILDRVGDGFTAEETRAGVDFMTLTAPGRYDTADAIADEAVTLAQDGLPLTFTSDTVAAMRQLAAADLDTAWRDHVDREWTVVVVGDAASHRDGLAALGRGVTVVPA